MAGLNKVIIIGRVGKDPELKSLSSQQTVCTFSVATSDTWKKDGQKQEKTEWHNIVCWEKLAENVGKFVKKGSQVAIVGKLQTRSWDKDGQKFYKTEILASEVTFLSGTGSKEQTEDVQTTEEDPDVPF